MERLSNLPKLPQLLRGGVCRPCGFFRMMHGGVSAPSCCAFTHRVAFEEVSGSKGKARAELRPARRQSRLPHSCSLLLPGRER